jgi:hypothetical protein
VDGFVDSSPGALSPPTHHDGPDSERAAPGRIGDAFAEGEAFFGWTHRRVDGTEFPAEVKLGRFEYDGRVEDNDPVGTTFGVGLPRADRRTIGTIPGYGGV